MGTNYYLIVNEFPENLEQFKNTVSSIIERVKQDNSRFYDLEDIIAKVRETLDNNVIHLGKKSYGWRFLFNLNGRKYYSNKNELMEFISRNRIINEYKEDVTLSDFMSIAFNDNVNLKKNQDEFITLYDYETIYFGIDGLEFVDRYFS